MKAPRIDHRGRFITIDEAEIYFEVIGDGEPVILLHGGTGDVEDMDGIAEKLAQKYQVISVNFRGHGRSTCPLPSISYQRFADDTINILKHLTDRSTKVVGFSDGGIVGLLMAAQQPNMINKVVAIGANTSVMGLRQQMRNWQSNAPAYDNFNDTMQRLWQTEITVPLESLQKIHCPTLIIGGDRDECITVEHFVEIYQQLANGFLSIVPGANHCESAYRPHICDSIIIPFLDN